MAPNLGQFAIRTGLAVVSIDYRLSDEAKFPAPIVDAKTAVRWVRSVADSFGFDKSRIGLWGSSAGAHIAACAALSREDMFVTEEHDLHSSAVLAVVDGYGPTDFASIDRDRASIQSVSTDVEGFVIPDLLPAGNPDSFESRLLGVPVESSPEEVKAANPVRYVRPGSPAFLILHGEADNIIPWQQSSLLFQALQSVGADATMVLFEKLKHGFFNNPKLEDADYGKVTVHENLTALPSQICWKCDPTQNIPAMVESFLTRHLSDR